jgi:hypothetical protein
MLKIINREIFDFVYQRKISNACGIIALGLTQIIY